MQRGWRRLCRRSGLPASRLRSGARSRRPGAQRLPCLPVPRLRVRCHRPMRCHALRAAAPVRQTEGLRDARNSRSGFCLAGQRRTAAAMGASGSAADGRRLVRNGILERPVPGTSAGNDRELRGPRPSALCARLQQRERGRSGIGRRRLAQELLRLQANPDRRRDKKSSPTMFLPSPMCMGSAIRSSRFANISSIWKPVCECSQRRSTANSSK